MPTPEHVVGTAIIAVAGLGSRLGHGIPKCLLKIAGKTLLQRVLELLPDVQDIRVVVGYREELVIEELIRWRRDVVVVRNPDYRSTTTQDSYALGGVGIRGHCLFLDGDLLLEPRSFREFLCKLKAGRPALAITPARTEQAVFVDLAGDDESSQVVSMSYTGRSEWEWSNVSWIPAELCMQGKGAVFEMLQQHLPIDAHIIQSWEVDTEADLSLATSAAMTLFNYNNAQQL